MATTDQTTEIDALYEQSMKLAPAQRLELSERLLLSVPPPGDDRTEEEWKQEIERRVKEYEADPTTVVPAEEVDRDVQQRIEEIRRLQEARQD
ncbi:MAG: addiction module protein [Planctomycetaceae bacterium]